MLPVWGSKDLDCGNCRLAGGGLVGRRGHRHHLLLRRGHRLALGNVLLGLRNSWLALKLGCRGWRIVLIEVALLGGQGLS